MHYPDLLDFFSIWLHLITHVPSVKHSHAHTLIPLTFTHADCLLPCSAASSLFLLFSISKRARAHVGSECLVGDFLVQASKGRRRGAVAHEEAASAGLGCQLEISLRERVM